MRSVFTESQFLTKEDGDVGGRVRTWVAGILNGGTYTKRVDLSRESLATT